MFKDRKSIYKEYEKTRDTKIISYFTTCNMPRPYQNGISGNVLPRLSEYLDRVGFTNKITLILHTNGGSVLDAYQIINLIKEFCNEVEILIPEKALSSGTLISLGANKIIMTKHSVIGPIDPSLGNLSVEDVNGFLEFSKNYLSKKDKLNDIFLELSKIATPNILGKLYRTSKQIRMLADELLVGQKIKKRTKKKIIDLLCSKSGSHEYTIGPTKAKKIGLNIEIISNLEYNNDIKQLKLSINDDLQLKKLQTNNFIINNCIIETSDETSSLQEVFIYDKGKLIKKGSIWI